MKFSIVFFFFFIHNLLLFSQQPPPPEQETVVDSLVTVNPNEGLPTDSLLRVSPQTNNKVYPKKLDPNFRNKYQGKDFDYTTIQPKESFWEKLKRRLKKIFEAIFGKIEPQNANDTTMVILKILGIIIIAFLLYLIIKFLMDKEGSIFFSKRNQKLNIRTTELQENIHEINFPKTIKEFELAKDFRYAIRYQFLFLLKKMNDKNIIHWNPEKTNKDYFIEINNPEQKEKYRQLAYIFDNVWYGEFMIDEEKYDSLKTEFEQSGF